jgi:hypothetical protein
MTTPVPWTSRPYFTVSYETPPTWRARSLYLYPPGTGWHSYTPGHWVPICRLLRPAGLRWRYSNQPPRGVLTNFSHWSSLHSLGEDHTENTTSNISSNVPPLFMAAEGHLLHICLAGAASSCSTISGFSHHGKTLILNYIPTHLKRIFSDITTYEMVPSCFLFSVLMETYKHRNSAFTGLNQGPPPSLIQWNRVTTFIVTCLTA